MAIGTIGDGGKIAERASSTKEMIKIGYPLIGNGHFWTQRYLSTVQKLHCQLTWNIVVQQDYDFITGSGVYPIPFFFDQTKIYYKRKSDNSQNKLIKRYINSKPRTTDIFLVPDSKNIVSGLRDINIGSSYLTRDILTQICKNFKTEIEHSNDLFVAVKGYEVEQKNQLAVYLQNLRCLIKELILIKWNLNLSL